jgi:hypothetical protein
MPMKLMMPPAAMAACAALGACNAPEQKPAAPVATVAAAKPCDAYKVGDKGVSATWCGGKAVAKLNVGGKDYTLSGGTCAKDGASVTLNIGVQSTGGIEGAKPDYIGLTVFNPKPGPYYNAPLKMVLDGKEMSVNPNHGDFNAKDGTIEGETRFSHQVVKGTFTCS